MTTTAVITLNVVPNRCQNVLVLLVARQVFSQLLAGAGVPFLSGGCSETVVAWCSATTVFTFLLGLIPALTVLLSLL